MAAVAATLETKPEASPVSASPMRGPARRSAIWAPDCSAISSTAIRLSLKSMTWASAPDSATSAKLRAPASAWPLLPPLRRSRSMPISVPLPRAAASPITWALRRMAALRYSWP